jgi:sugar phosphate isomerase/epimerase
LILSHYCLAAPPAERFEAAARAGFAGVALSWDELQAARASGGNPTGIRRHLAAAGLVAPQLEYLSLPAAGGEEAFRVTAREAAETAAEFGCETILVVALEVGASFERLADSFGLLADFCGRAGVKCAIEFVPTVTAVPDLATARRLVGSVGSLSAGLLVDSLHFYRSGAPWAELDMLSPAEVLAIQVNDGKRGPAGPDFAEEALGRRLLPGDGEFDLARFVNRLAAAAPEIPLTAEVINRELQQKLSAAELAQRIADRTRSLLAYR